MKILGKEQYKDLSIKEMQVGSTDAGTKAGGAQGESRAEEPQEIRPAGEPPASEARSRAQDAVADPAPEAKGRGLQLLPLRVLQAQASLGRRSAHEPPSLAAGLNRFSY